MLTTSWARSGRSLTGMMWSALRVWVAEQNSQKGDAFRALADNRFHRVVLVWT